jgi:hypothetical protein
VSQTVLLSAGARATPVTAGENTAGSKRPRAEKSVSGQRAGGLTPVLLPPVSAETLQTLAQPALNAIGECLGLVKVPTRMGAAAWVVEHRGAGVCDSRCV